MKTNLRAISVIALLLIFALNPFLITINQYSAKPKSSNGDLTFIFGIDSGIQDLDPQDSWDDDSYLAITQICEGLFKYNLSDSNLNIIPNLATDFGTWTFDGLNYTLSLKSGIQFHDGTQFDADAVVFTFTRLHYLIGIGFAKIAEIYKYYDIVSESYQEIINRVERLDDFLVRFILNTPYAPFEALLCFPSSVILSPTSTPATTVIDTATGDLIGTGPFVYDNYLPGLEVNFHAFDQYRNGVANITNLKFKILPTEQNRIDALLNSDVDLIIDKRNSRENELSNLPNVFESNPNFIINKIIDSEVEFIGMNNNWINQSFRKAISYAFNYSFLIDLIRQNHAIRLKSPIPSTIYYSNDTLNAAICNLTKAREIMQNMGYGVGYTIDTEWTDHAYSLNGKTPFITLNFTYNIGSDLRESFYTLLTINLANIGICLLDAGTTWANFIFKAYNLAGLIRDNLQLFQLDWHADYNDPCNFIEKLFSNRTTDYPDSNLVSYNGYQSAIEMGRNPFNINDNVQLLMEKAIQELDNNIRQGYYNRIQQLLVEEDMPWVYCFSDYSYFAYRNGISGLSINSLKNLWFFNIEVHIAVDREPPIITILSPTHSQIYGLNPPTFELAINEPNLDSTWYSIFNGTEWFNNISFTGLTGTIDSDLWKLIGNGSKVIRFYANDTNNKFSFADVTIIKDISSSEAPLEIFGYNTIIIISVLLIGGLVIYLKKNRNKI